MEYSRWPLFWLILSSCSVSYDSMFVLSRPRSLPEGDFATFFRLSVSAKFFELYSFGDFNIDILLVYHYYITIDTPYGDMDNVFTWAQTWLNVAEIFLQLVTIYLMVYKHPLGCFVGFLTQTMTFWKTVLYMLQYTSLCYGTHLIEHLDMPTLIFCFVIPNCIWIVVPFLMMVYFGRRIVSTLLNEKSMEKTD